MARDLVLLVVGFLLTTVLGASWEVGCSNGRGIVSGQRSSAKKSCGAPMMYVRKLAS